MQITHNNKLSHISGKLSEYNKIVKWIAEAQKIDKEIIIAGDESDEDETCFAILRDFSSQEERAEIFSEAKKRI